MSNDKPRFEEVDPTVKLAKVAVTWGFLASMVEDSLRLTAADDTDWNSERAMVVVR